MCVYFYISPQENFCFRDVVRFYLLGDGMGEGLIIFIKRAVWVLQDVLQYLILIEIFEIQLFFSISIYFSSSIYCIKTLKFSRQFGFQG